LTSQPPQPLGITQAANLAKPVDIAELANLTNCKKVPAIVNPNEQGIQVRVPSSNSSAKSLPRLNLF
jgi:hypothetical protein